jgi:hypothetical protein
VLAGSLTEIKVGRVVLKYGATCEWRCLACKKSVLTNRCYCDCSIECDVVVSFTDTWDFRRHQNDPWWNKTKDAITEWLANNISDPEFGRQGTPFVVVGVFETTATANHKKKCTIADE